MEAQIKQDGDLITSDRRQALQRSISLHQRRIILRFLSQEIIHFCLNDDV